MKAVILAAGEGTRLIPITYHIPKPMLPFYGKPFMAYTVENLSNIVESVVIVVNHKQEQIRDYFGKQFASLSVKYVVQQELQGTGSAVMTVEDLVDDKFLVIQADVYASRKLLRDMTEINAEYALSLVKVDDPENHAGVQHQEGIVKKVFAESEWVDQGIWLLSSGIFDQIEKMKLSENMNELRMLIAVQKLIDQGSDVKAHLAYEPWIELGDHAPLESVLKALAFFRVVDASLYRPDSSIGFEIELKNCEIRNSLIFGKGKIIGSRIKNSVIYLRGVVNDQEITDQIVALDSVTRGK